MNKILPPPRKPKYPTLKLRADPHFIACGLTLEFNSLLFFTGYRSSGSWLMPRFEVAAEDVVRACVYLTRDAADIEMKSIYEWYSQHGAAADVPQPGDLHVIECKRYIL